MANNARSPSEEPRRGRLTWEAIHQSGSSVREGRACYRAREACARVCGTSAPHLPPCAARAAQISRSSRGEPPWKWPMYRTEPLSVGACISVYRSIFVYISAMATSAQKCSRMETAVVGDGEGKRTAAPSLRREIHLACCEADRCESPRFPQPP